MKNKCFAPVTFCLRFQRRRFLVLFFFNREDEDDEDANKGENDLNEDDWRLHHGALITQGAYLTSSNKCGEFGKPSLSTRSNPFFLLFLVSIFIFNVSCLDRHHDRLCLLILPPPPPPCASSLLGFQHRFVDGKNQTGSLAALGRRVTSDRNRFPNECKGI